MGEFVWVDDCDIQDEISTVVQEIFSGRDRDVCVALPDNKPTSLDRGATAIKLFKNYLDEHIQQQTLPKGIILDIQIPIPCLSYFDKKYEGIPTNNGADTGFQLAKFVLNNYGKEGEYESEYGDYFKIVPVLFLSISNFDRPPKDTKQNQNPYTRWMEERYQNLSDIDTEGSLKPAYYFHLLKRDMRRERKLLGRWIQWCNEYNP